MVLRAFFFLFKPRGDFPPEKVRQGTHNYNNDPAPGIQKSGCTADKIFQHGRAGLRGYIAEY
jgi:hypothetical protein